MPCKTLRVCYLRHKPMRSCLKFERLFCESMENQMIRKFSVATIAVAMVISCCFPILTDAQQDTSAQDTNKSQQLATEFELLSLELEAMRDLFDGGKDGQPVSFDSEGALRQGFSSASIQLAQELTSATNEILRKMNKALKKGRSNMKNLRLDLSAYPALSPYLETATERSFEPPKKEMSTAGVVGVSEYYCGCFWRPLPSSAAAWRSSNSSNPSSTLRSWGYHSTPSLVGGGWTRAQNHMWWLCGWGTYRDHAYIQGNTILEQNYAGYSPRGEPNPEIYASGPWPYSYWPTYVYWWHRYGPGR